MRWDRIPSCHYSSNKERHVRLSLLSIENLEFASHCRAPNLTYTVIPPGRMSGPAPVLSTSRCISCFVSSFGWEWLPPNVGRYEYSIEKEARRGSRNCEALIEEIAGSVMKDLGEIELGRAVTTSRANPRAIGTKTRRFRNK